MRPWRTLAAIDIQVALRPASAENDAQDITVATLHSQSVSLLAANASKTFNASFTLPIGLDANDYTIVTKVDTNNSVTELDETNNTAGALTAIGDVRTIHVVRGFVNLSGVFGTSTVPAHLTTLQAISGKVSVSLQNIGRVAMPVGQVVTINVYAHRSARPTR